jgi:protein TonB
VRRFKPVVAKAEEVTEDPPNCRDKRLVPKLKGDPDAVLSVAPVGPGPTKIVEEDNQIYNTAGIEVKPEFPGGMDKFYSYVGKTIVHQKKKVLKVKFMLLLVEKMVH